MIKFIKICVLILLIFPLSINVTYSQAIDVGQIYKQGNKFGAEGKFEKAKKEFEQALITDPSHNYEHAHINLKIIEDLNKQTIGADTAKLLFKGQQSSYDERIVFLGQAIKTDLKYPISYYLRGNIYLKKSFSDEKNLDPSIADFSVAIEKTKEMEPHVGYFYLRRGLAYNGKNENDLAIEDLNKSLEINPKSLTSYLALGAAYRSKGQKDLELSAYNKAIAADPKFPEAYYSRAQYYSNQKELDRAITDYSSYLNLKPMNVYVYSQRGKLYMEKKQYEKALIDFNKAIEIRPDDEYHYNDRARAYYHLKNYNRAWEDVHKAQELGLTVSKYFLKDLSKASGRVK